MWFLAFAAWFVIGLALGGAAMAFPALVVYGLPLAFAFAAVLALVGVALAWWQRRQWQRSDSEAARRALLAD